MLACKFFINNRKCNIPKDNEGDEYCYIHTHLLTNAPLTDKDLFLRILKNHPSFLLNRFDYDLRMHIGFDLDFKKIYNNFQGNQFRLENIVFSKKVNFSKMQVFSNVEVINCQFEDIVDFREIKFTSTKSELHSRLPTIIKLNHQFRKITFNGDALFQNSKFENTYFKDIDFSKAYFLGAEFSSCNFINVNWYKSGILFKRKCSCKDEESLRRYSTEHIETASELEKLYRNLKLQGSELANREMEGEFCYSENEMIRKRIRWYKQLFTSKFWYYLVSRYAERPSWAFINIVLIIFFWTLGYIFTGIKINPSEKLLNYCNFKICDYWYYLAHSISPVTLNKWQITTAPNLRTYFLSIAEGSILAIQIGLFVMAFRRKFQR